MSSRRVIAVIVMLSGITLAHAAATTPIPDTLRQQAASGDAHAQDALGHALAADGVAADMTAAVDWYRKAALQGNADGAWMLGSAYMGMGSGLARDPISAIDWMRKSVLLDGDPDHMAMLGLYMQITGNQQEAVHWLQQSAEKGAPKGMIFLAMAYVAGQSGLPKDPAVAEHWLLLAAQKGDPEAQMMLGGFYLTDTLGRTDTAAAIRWLQAAADGGNADAAGTLASLYLTGKFGIAVDGPRGVALARKALAANNKLGHYAMGLAYMTGTGIEKDAAKAWYQLAVAERMDNNHQLSNVANHMSSVATQLSAAQLDDLKAQVDRDVPAAKPEEQAVYYQASKTP